MAKANEDEETIGKDAKTLPDAIAELDKTYRDTIERHTKAIQNDSLYPKERPTYEQPKQGGDNGRQQTAPEQYSYIKISDGRLIYEFMFPGVGQVNIHSADQSGH